MSSQSNPNPEPTAAEDRRDSTQDPEEAQTLAQHRRGVAREQAHDRKIGLAHHRSQTHEVHGGRSAMKHRDETDWTRARGRAKPRQERGGMGAGPETGQPAEERVQTAGPPAIAATTQFAQQILGKQATTFDNPEEAARKIDPVSRPEGLPRDHPAVVSEVKFDRISRLMQPGSNDEVDQRLSGGIEGYDDGLEDNDDDWIS